MCILNQGSSMYVNQSIGMAYTTVQTTVHSYQSVYHAVETVILIAWCLVCVVLGTVGNLLVLTRFGLKGVRLDRFTLIFIQHLALSDLLYLALRVLPALISHSAKGWVLGPEFCHFEGTCYLIPVVANIGLLMIISLQKVISCALPLRRFTSSKHNAHLVACGIWAVSAVVPIMNFVIMDVQVNRELDVICEPVIDTASQLQLTLAIVLRVQMMLPGIMILPLNIALWLLANNYAKAHNRSNKQAIVTILSLCFIYIFVWLPTFIEETYSLLTPRHHVHTTPLPLWFNKLHIYIYFAGTLANPILYTLINSKFRNASKRRIYNAMVMKMSYQSSSTPSVQTVKKRVVISNSLPVERLRAEGKDNAFHSE